MKLAVATDGTMVAAHFGRCEAYTLVDVAGGQVGGREVVANPGHEPGFLPRFLAGLGVDVIVAGGMGPRAQGLFAERGIRTVVGVTGPVDKALEHFAAGRLAAGDSLCEHGPGHEHDCGG